MLTATFSAERRRLNAENVAVNRGSVLGGAGLFEVDHPLDPAAYGFADDACLRQLHQAGALDVDQLPAHLTHLGTCRWRVTVDMRLATLHCAQPGLGTLHPVGELPS